jgi:hypothetical protein
MATMLAAACSKSSLPSETTVDGATTTAPSPSAAKQETKTLIRFINVRRRPAFTDVQPHLDVLSKLPLEKRYVWRVASALKWGLADFDDVTVAADRDTLNPEDFAKVMQLLRFRPIQFCMFLKALVGADEMERLVNQGITAAKQG